ncbi:MAG: hypothetical protein HXS46_03745 [Theionarchaea archaeon]|nr:MAG: hypothetical protein AYK18_17430 [Theionarchaea archaeon DG-70]MBU7009777.1 hypothetical protein [Theionarchaea archaeon]
MKHEFVLDENLLYLGIKGTDENGKPDSTTAKLPILILKNCHKIIVDKELNRRFKNHLKKLKRISRKEPVIPGMDEFVRNLLHNNNKIIWYFLPLDSVPDEKKMPRKDIHVVRAGYHFSAKIVTVDKTLARAISSSFSLKERGVTVLHPKEAITLAQETQEPLQL